MRRTPVVEIAAQDFGARRLAAGPEARADAALGLLQGARRLRQPAAARRAGGRRRRGLGRQPRRRRGLCRHAARTQGAHLRARDLLAGQDRAHPQLRRRSGGRRQGVRGSAGGMRGVHRRRRARCRCTPSIRSRPCWAQGSVGLELESQAPDLDTLLVAVGGGGLIGGIAAWYEGRIKIVGVEPGWRRRCSMALAAGRPVDAPAGGIAADSLAPKRIGELVFPIAQRHVAARRAGRGRAIAAAQRRYGRRCASSPSPARRRRWRRLLSGAYVAGATASASACWSRAPTRRRSRSSPRSETGEGRHAALTLRAASSQPLIFSMSGGSPLRSRRWPSFEAANARTSAHSLSASAAAMASAVR